MSFKNSIDEQRQEVICTSIWWKNARKRVTGIFHTVQLLLWCYIHVESLQHFNSFLEINSCCETTFNIKELWCHNTQKLLVMAVDDVILAHVFFFLIYYWSEPGVDITMHILNCYSIQTLTQSVPARSLLHSMFDISQ